MIRIGACYDLGTGVPQNDWPAVAWYQKAAQKGNAAAQFNLAKMYESGRGVHRPDAATARDYSMRAAAAGSDEARRRLAHWPY